jgi:cell division protein FtsB
MNLYAPTGEKIENWPLWVRRLTDENMVLKSRVIDLEKQNDKLSKETSELKRRCCDIWKQLTEEQARQA